MHRGTIAIILFIFFYTSPQAQQLQSSWQQQVNYTIGVRLDDVTQMLHAFESIEYVNNSPAELNEIYFHLWPNAYSSRNTAFAKQQVENNNTDFYFAPDPVRGFIDSLAFTVDGQSVKMVPDAQNPDICKLILNSPLKSGSRINISTPFRVKIPFVFSRMGHGDQSYQISQWYPKPAVYDANGWNAMPYLDQGEFYSEFGSFDVSITLPENYLVASTGVLQNEAEREFLLQRSKQERDSIDKKVFPPSSSTFKTLRYVQDNIHDFAWFADKRYNVSRSQVVLPRSGRTVESWVFDYSRSGQVYCGYINEAVAFYSEKIGEYPYAHATVVEGAIAAGGGMEYPMVTVIDAPDEQVIVHEVGHNWFYGILGSNERRYPWMDEGINSFYEQWCIDSFASNVKLNIPDNRLIRNAVGDLSDRSLMEVGYQLSARRNEDQPIGLSSEEFSYYNYGVMVYGKAAQSIWYLKSYLGDTVFNLAMQTYFETWKFKHPLPGDIRKVFETVSGKNLGWFFDDLINTTATADYKITAIKKRTGTQGDYFYSVSVKNKGKLASPFVLGSMKGDSSIRLNKIEGFSGKQEIIVTEREISKFRIDPLKLMPEINRKNNTIRTRGILKKVDPISFLPFGGLDNPFKTQIAIVPIIAWNQYNRTMAGLGFHNITLVPRKAEYILAPLFSFETKDLNGYAKLNLNIIPKTGPFKRMEIGVNSSRFSYRHFSGLKKYQKISPYFFMELKEKSLRSRMHKTLKIAHYYINENMNNGFRSRFLRNDSTNQFVTADLGWSNNRAVDPFSVKLNFQQSILNRGSNFLKIGLEGMYKMSYGRVQKNLQIRVFGGKLFYKGSQLDGNYELRLTGNTGRLDYLYEHALMDRSEVTSLFSKQVLQREGGFKAVPDVGRSKNWILALNLRSSIPTKLPLKLYADLGTFAEEKKFIYQAGIMFNISEVFEVYFPVISSQEIKAAYDVNPIPNDTPINRYFQKVSFRLDLNRLDPVKLIRSIAF